MELERLIGALRDPGAYPRPGAVDVLQTHASVLFFVGDRVYKIKKPVDLGFLDFTTLERRRHFCAEEVRVNAALAPGVYRRVAPIAQDARGRVRVDGTGEPVEYAVEMVRLPADRMLDLLITDDRVPPATIDRIVGVLARFHDAAAHGPEVARHGSPESVRRKLERNLEQAATFGGSWSNDPGPASPTVPRLVFEHLRAWTDRTLRRRQALLASRAPSGRVREGHGDLHAGNICLTDGVVIYDRIEFDMSFRCCDVAADLAFLAMDFDFRGRRDLGRLLTDRYAERTGDPDLLLLQDLYRSHFACVRGKVASIRARETELPEPDRRAAWAEGARYFHLAAGYTLGPALILTCGLPGSGKSRASNLLANPLDAEVLSSDRIRKELAGMKPTDHWRGPGAGPYTPEMTARTYGTMLDRADAALGLGRSVVADATFATRALRAPFLVLATRRAVPLLVVLLWATDGVIRARLGARSADTDEVSDADWAVYEAARGHFEPPDEVPAAARLDAGTPELPETFVGRAIERLVPPHP